ncbi:hypothetical protein [Enemella sp. A6]|uniref:hypothetical protein n=1 Tax=Enemella sp. A6 TaxID=3440152 RepID=UPI003EBC5136
MTNNLEKAFDGLLDSIRRATGEMRGHEYYEDEQNRARGHMFLTSMLIARLEEHVIFDPAFPYFRVLDHRVREGGDNPDQRYLISQLLPGVAYKVWGRLGDAHRLEFQVYAGDPYLNGRMASYLSFEDLEVNPDGTFEVFVDDGPARANWLQNPTDSTKILVRQVYSDWDTMRDPGEVHIDRVGAAGELKPEVSADELAERLNAAAQDLLVQARAWPASTLQSSQRRAPNEMGVPMDPGSLGGVPGRWMCRANFDLRDDECLVVTLGAADAHYFGIQLSDNWFSSLEYANRQSSLTSDQAVADQDGLYRFVICAEDPGHPNWLDTCGLRTGDILLRWDGTSGPLPDDHSPRMVKTTLGELAEELPADSPTVSDEERAAQIARRRAHVQRRYGC